MCIIIALVNTIKKIKNLIKLLLKAIHETNKCIHWWG